MNIFNKYFRNPNILSFIKIPIFLLNYYNIFNQIKVIFATAPILGQGPGLNGPAGPLFSMRLAEEIGDNCSHSHDFSIHMSGHLTMFHIGLSVNP
jgi:hypothetical protein